MLCWIVREDDVVQVLPLCSRVRVTGKVSYFGYLLTFRIVVYSFHDLKNLIVIMVSGQIKRGPTQQQEANIDQKAERQVFTHTKMTLLSVLVPKKAKNMEGKRWWPFLPSSCCLLLTSLVTYLHYRRLAKVCPTGARFVSTVRTPLSSDKKTPYHSKEFF